MNCMRAHTLRPCYNIGTGACAPLLTRCPYPDCRHTFEIADTGVRTEGQCVRCRRPATYRSLEALAQIDSEHSRRFERGAASGGRADPAAEHLFTAVLEDVRSLWNVGSIFRSADGAGFSHLHLCGITGSPPRKEILKTSLGAEDHVRWQCYPSALDPLFTLKDRGVQLIGLEVTADSILLSAAIENSLLSPPLCLVVGNEVRGLSTETRAVCDLICHLPMRGMKESLNVAVAFGIAAYMLSDALS